MTPIAMHNLNKSLTDFFRRNRQNEDQPHFEKIGKQIGKSPKSNTAQNDQFKHLVKKYNLDRTQRNRLHERISKEGLSLKEIEKIIQDGDY